MQEKYVSRAILFNSDHKILLGRRARGMGTGLFALVGGKPEGDESPLQALIREIQEEIGLTLQFTFWKEIRNESLESDVVWVASYFYGLINAPASPDPSEISEIIFVGELDIDSLPLAFDHKTRLREFFAAGILGAMHAQEVPDP